MSGAYDSFVRDRLPPPQAQPEFLFGLPELRYPERLNAAVELLRTDDPGRPAIIGAGARSSYADLDALSARIAHMLVEREGLRPGNRVLLSGANGTVLFAAWLGILKAGGVVVATVPVLRAGEVGKVLAKAEISHALADRRVRAAVDEAGAGSEFLRSVVAYDGDEANFAEELAEFDAGFGPVDTGRDDPALIAFTSGTTGMPKGCVHYHRDILASADSFARHVLAPQPGMRWACTAPLAFTFGLGMQFVFPLRFGGTAVIPAKPGPEGLLDAIEREGVAICATAPTAYRAMLAMLEGRDISSLERCVSAGEHLPEATWNAWREATGLGIVDGIGATEMMHIFISASGGDIRPGATGRPVPGYRATLLDENEDGIGRLAVKGPTGCRYLADKRQADYVIDGWNVTGDLFRRDDDGYYWYVARADDLIVTSGYNVAAPEVEAALQSHPAVAECAVTGAPCERRGTLIRAFVVAAAEEQSEDRELACALQEHVKAMIAPYKCPHEILFIEALPKTATGKLQRSALRQSGAMSGLGRRRDRE